MPPPSAGDWMRRERHRLAGVFAVKSAPDNRYQLLDSIVAGGFFDARDKPSTPDPHDVTISKRAWEEQLGEWRQKLRCAMDKATASDARDDDTIGGRDAEIVTESTTR